MSETIPKEFTNIFSYPRLNSILMVEELIKKNSTLYSKKRIWEMLPKKMKYQTYCVIIDYLQYSNKIGVDKEKKIVWIDYKPNKELIQKGVEI